MMPLLREDGAARCTSSRVRYTVLLHGTCCCEQEKNSSYSVCLVVCRPCRNLTHEENCNLATPDAWL